MVKEKKMKAFIYTGGEIDCAGITERPEEQDIVIAADSGYKNAKLVAKELVDIFKNGGTDEDAFKYFSDKFYHGRLKEVYPLDAMTLNTNIMINLIKKELM